MEALFCMQTVAADAAADAAMINLRKQRELEMELKDIDKQWLFALKKIVNDRLDLIKEFDKIARVKVHRDYFRGDLKKAKLHNYTDHARSRMLEQKYFKSHDNFDFTVDPLGKQVVAQPMIMEGDGKTGREEITSTYLDKSKAKHIRGLSELGVKVRRFRVPKFRKKKKKQELPTSPAKTDPRLKRVKIQEPEFADLEELEGGNRDPQATSISIQYTEVEDRAAQSVFTQSDKILPRMYIPLPSMPLTPEVSFVNTDPFFDLSSLKPPQSPTEIKPRLLSPMPPQYVHRHVKDNGEPRMLLSPILNEQQVNQFDIEQNEQDVQDVAPQRSPPKTLKLTIPESSLYLPPISPRSPSQQDSGTPSPRTPGSYLPPPPSSPIPPHLKLLTGPRRKQSIEDAKMSEITKEFLSLRRGSIPYPRRSSISMLPKNNVQFAITSPKKTKQKNPKDLHPLPSILKNPTLSSEGPSTTGHSEKGELRPLPSISRSDDVGVKRETSNKQKAFANLSRSMNSVGKQKSKPPPLKLEKPAIPPIKNPASSTSGLSRLGNAKQISSQSEDNLRLGKTSKLSDNSQPMKSSQHLASSQRTNKSMSVKNSQSSNEIFTYNNVTIGDNPSKNDTDDRSDSNSRRVTTGTTGPNTRGTYVKNGSEDSLGSDNTRGPKDTNETPGTNKTEISLDDSSTGTSSGTNTDVTDYSTNTASPQTNQNTIDTTTIATIHPAITRTDSDIPVNNYDDDAVFVSSDVQDTSSDRTTMLDDSTTDSTTSITNQSLLVQPLSYTSRKLSTVLEE